MIRGGERRFRQVMQQFSLPNISGKAAAGKQHQVRCYCLTMWGEQFGGEKLTLSQYYPPKDHQQL